VDHEAAEMSQPKTLLLTAYDSAMAPIGDLTSPLMLAYANRHGYDFHCSRQFDVGCESYWQKVWDIRAFTSLSNPIRKEYDRIMWLDADQVITNPDWTPPWDKGAHFSLDWGIDAITDDHFSACGFVVCRDAFGIFSSVAERHYLYREKEFPEQAALRGIRQNLSREREMMFIHDRRVFNAVPIEICEEAPDPWQKGDFCAHLTHVPVDTRVEIFHIIREQVQS
jgi:hypothetical protein